MIGAGRAMCGHRFIAGLFGCAALAASASFADVGEERVLYEKTSAYNTIVVSEEQDGVRTLRFGRGEARQSVAKPGDPDYLALPYTRAALVGLALSGKPRRFLVVGLGGGVLPMFLRKYYPEVVIDAVDIDPEVLAVAKKFFGFREDPLMKAHVADGRQFIEQSREPYDVIFLDAYGSDSIPRHLTTQEFLQAVRRAVAPDGVVVGNLWGGGVNPLYDSMVRTYQEVFDEVLILEVRSSANRILLALPRRQMPDRDELMELARKTSTARQFPFDLADPVRYGFLGARAKSQHEHILRDRDLDERQRNP